jgi:hypothetical protein
MKKRNYNGKDESDDLFNLSLKDTNFLTWYNKQKGSIGIIEACEIYEYEITGKLIEELVEIHNFELEELEYTTIRFYTNKPQENYSKTLQEKFEKFKEKDVPLKYTLIAKAYSERNKVRIKQKSAGLKLKRVRLPKSVAFLVQHSDLINCKNKEEIKNLVV